MEIQLDPKILAVIASLEVDITHAVNEALTMWLKKRFIVCPITKQLCKTINGSCNDCSILKE